jgi:adenosylcobinamide amidohydrolase
VSHAPDGIHPLLDGRHLVPDGLDPVSDARPRAYGEPRPVLDGPRLVVDLGRVHRCLSSAVFGGGLGRMRTWLNLQVPLSYSRVDPGADLAGEAADLPGPVVGMMTAAPVAAYAEVRSGLCRAVATAGVRHAMAAAATRPRPVAAAEDAGDGTGPGTINLLVVVGVPLAAPGLVNALATAVEAKVQALAAARIPARNADGFATGTATDAICVACPPGRGSMFAGPATRVGGDAGRAVYGAVLAAIAARGRSVSPGDRAGGRGPLAAGTPPGAVPHWTPSGAVPDLVP